MIKRYRSPSIIKKQRKKLYRKSGVYIGVVLVLIVGLSLLAHIKSLQLEHIAVKGTATVSESDVQQIFNQDISGNYLMLFPKSNIFIYPKKKITEDINTDYKQIKDLKIDFAGFQGVNVEVQERKPYALWCSTPDASSTDCYFLDNTGFIYAHAPFFSGDAFFKFFGTVTGDPIGSSYIDADHLNQIASMVDELKKSSLDIIGMQVDNEHDYIAFLKEGGKILFNDDDGFDVVKNNLETVFAQNGLNVSDIPKIDYINLRFGKKVFFKLKEQK